MSLDERVQPQRRPFFGCHSELDKYRAENRTSCTLPDRSTEKACEGCGRRDGETDISKVGDDGAVPDES